MKLKSRTKVILTICVLALVIFSLTGCADILNAAFGKKWTFKNMTLYTVHITNIETRDTGLPGTPSVLTLSPGDEEDTFVMGDTIRYTYDHADDIRIVQDGTRLTIYYDL